MKQWTILSTVAAVALAAGFSASAQTTVSETLFNEDGTVYDQQPPTTTTPINGGAGLSILSGFGNTGISAGSAGGNYLYGLGTMQYTVTGAGTYDFIVFIDDEADLANGFVNDYGFVSGTLPSYLSWEIGNPIPVGNNAANSSPGNDLLDDSNDTPGGSTDIAFALGFDFTLGANETATIDVALTSSAPEAASFVLGQGNGDDPDYFSGTLNITPNTPPVSTPDNGATWLILTMGLAGLAGMMRFERGFSRNNG
jgi:hypothetical protein